MNRVSPREKANAIKGFANELRALSRSRGYASGRQLAARTLASHARVAAALRGIELPTASTVGDILKACDVPTQEQQDWLGRRDQIATMTVISERTNPPPEEHLAVGRGAAEPIHDHADPDDVGAALDARSHQPANVYLRGERRVLGIVELRHSVAKRVAWGRFSGNGQLDALASARGDVTIEIAVRRHSDGATATFLETYAFAPHWSNLLLVDDGAFSAEVVLRFGGSVEARRETAKVTLI